MLQSALSSKASSNLVTGALKAQQTAPNIYPPATKRPRGVDFHSEEEEEIIPEKVIQGNENNVLHETSLEDEEEQSHSASRWQASEQLTSFLGTMHKPLSAFERNAICRNYPRPDVEAIYTPVLDNYLSSLVPGIKAVDKEKKFVHDRLLDAAGPMSMLFEHIYQTHSETKPGDDMSTSYEQVNEMGSMVSNSLRLLGNTSALLSKDRRTAVLQKINSKGTLSSLASEEFPKAGKHLFGEGFEERNKTHSETAKTLIQASTVGVKPTQFFRGRTTQFRHWSGTGRGSTYSFINNQPHMSFRGQGRASKGFYP